MVMVVMTTAIVGAISGSMMRKNTWNSLAPSTRAASSRSPGILRSAAANIVMVKPVQIQMPITVSSTVLTGGGEASQVCGCPPNMPSNGVEQANIGVRMINKAPDDGRADERDRHRHEDNRFGHPLIAHALRQDRQQQAENRRAGNHHDQPQQRIAQRDLPGEVVSA